MKIVHVSTYPTGGATNAGYRLHKGLLNRGIDSSFLFLHSHTDLAKKEYGYYDEVSISTFQRIQLRIKERLYFRKLTKHLLGRPLQFEMFSGVNTPYRVNKLKVVQDADIIVLHWVSNFIDHATFFNSIDKPVVWVLHDMNPFTGGCHYAGACKEFTKSCSTCPQLEGTIDPHYSSKIHATKLKALSGFNKLSIVALSNWIYENSKQSSLFAGTPHYLIPNSIDSEVFKPRDQDHCRELLGLPTDKKIILFVADNVHNHRKGYAILLRSLEQMKDTTDVVLCQIGNSAGTDDIGDIPVVKLGVIKDELLMSTVYSSADVFVIPSLEDNLPNTVLESLMCATPVIGFASGGIKDMVIHEENGYLVEEPSADALAQALEQFLSGAHAFDKEAIREQTVAKYQLNVQADRYIALFNELIAER